MIRFSLNSIAKTLIKRLTLRESVTIVLLVIIIVVDLAWMIWYSKREYREVPVENGQFSEGIVATSQSEVDRQIKLLTHSALIRLDNNLEARPFIADKWSIKDQGRQYEFELAQGVDSSTLASALRQDKALEGIEIVDSPGKIILNLGQPYSYLLQLLSVPNIPIGPYIIKSQTSQTIELRANNDFPLGRPKINQIEIKIYPNETALKKQFSTSQIQAALTNQAIDLRPYQKVVELKTTRSQSLFFNLNRDTLGQTKRQKLFSGEQIDPSTIRTLVADTPAQRSNFELIKNILREKGLILEPSFVNQNVFDKELVPGRDYDSLLIGLDFGPLTDKFSLWHSSQIAHPGKNFALANSRELDRALEEARLSLSPEDRKKKEQKVNELIGQQFGQILLEEQLLKYNITSNLRGVESLTVTSPSGRFDNVWNWEIVRKKLVKKEARF